MRKLPLAFLLCALAARPALAAQKISVAPNPVDCGGAPPGMAATPVDITITNIGDAPLTLQPPSVSGPDAAAFGLNLNGLGFPLGINAGGAVTITVTFTPNAQRSFSATLNLPNNDPNNANLTVPLLGRGGFPAISFDTKTLIFGNQRVGVASAPSTFTINNPGAGDLIISQVALGGVNPIDFSIGPAMFAPIKPGANAKLSVVFKPTGLGGRSATISVTSNGAGGAQQVDTLTVLGSGTQAFVTCGPGAIDFGTSQIFTASVPQMATASNIVNMAPDSYNITGISISGAQSAWFSLSTPPKFPIKVMPNSTISIPLVAIPKATGPGKASVDIATDNNMTCSLPLTATGVTASIVVDPAYAEFGGVPVTMSAPPQTFTITNPGDLPLKLTDLELLDIVGGVDAALFSLMNAPQPSVNAPTIIAPKGQISFSVGFKPPVVRTASAYIEIHANDPMVGLLRVPVSGAGVMAGFSVNKSRLDFGQLPVGSVSTPQNVTLSNTGQSILNISKISNNNGMFQIAPTDPQTLDPGRSLTVNVVCSPISGGTFSDALTIAVDGQKAAVVSLTCTGLTATLGVSASALDFDRVQTGHSGSPQSVGLKAGPVPISIGKIESSDPAYAVDLSATNLKLAAGAQTRFDVTFSPTEAREHPATLKITLDGEAQPIQVIQLTGTGFLPRGCAMGGPSREGWPLALLLSAALLFSLRRRRPSK
jgi:hypothetical protein